MTSLRLPQFIIAGAPRTATTWLYELADRHPELAMAKPRQPEPKFFLIDHIYARGLAYYAATWFEPLPSGLHYGEKSTNYLENPTACARIARDLPGVRLIFMLRDPIQRAHSNYLWSMKNGHESETFGRALELEAKRERDLSVNLRYARPHAYFSRGLYAELLRPWFETFSRKQILALRTEDVAAEPREVARSLFTFLGVAERADLADDLPVINSARPDGSPPIDPDTRARLAARYEEPNTNLKRLLGPSFQIWGSESAKAGR